MSKPEILTGLDIGSSQITCVMGRRTEENKSIEVLGGAKIPCRGVKGGVVINLSETSYSIGHVIEEVEAQTKQNVKQLCIGLRGSHIESMNTRGAINISRTDKEITPEDVSGAIENAKTIRLSPDREILHTIPQEFSLNHQRGVPNPVGMEGNFLEVDVHILTASSSHLSNIYKSIGQAGFEILEPIYGYIAVGDFIVTQEEKELGCLLIDFGGLTTGLTIYTEGSIRFSKELQIGSDFITRDLSHSLRTSMMTAQDIKEKHGIAMAALLRTDSRFDYTAVDGRTIREGTRRQLVDIIQPRLDQIFVMIEEEIKKSNFYDAIIPGGVIITGGGSRLEGILQAAEQALNTSARTGLPQDVTGNDDIVLNPSYATAISLLAAGQSFGQQAAYSRPQKAGAGIIGRIRKWAEESF
jgi:cell division protein FtsA